MARLCYLPPTRERLRMWVSDLVTSEFVVIRCVMANVERWGTRINGCRCFWRILTDVLRRVMSLALTSSVHGVLGTLVFACRARGGSLVTTTTQIDRNQLMLCLQTSKMHRGCGAHTIYADVTTVVSHSVIKEVMEHLKKTTGLLQRNQWHQRRAKMYYLHSFVIFRQDEMSLF